jgi:hypothetical protein
MHNQPLAMMQKQMFEVAWQQAKELSLEERRRGIISRIGV